MMNWMRALVAVGAIELMTACTVPNPDYTIPAKDKPEQTEVSDPAALPVEDPDGRSQLEVVLDRGESLYDNPASVGKSGWPSALKSTQSAVQQIEFSESSGVAGDGSEGHILNFSGGSNVFKYSMSFPHGLRFGSAAYDSNGKVYRAFLNIPVNIIGEDYNLEKIEFRKFTETLKDGSTRNTAEMWIHLDSMDTPGKTAVFYDDNVLSDKYSKRHTAVNGEVLTNLDVKIEADLDRMEVSVIKVRNQVLPSENMNLGPCDSVRGYFAQQKKSPYSLLSDYFDIQHRGRKDCKENMSYHALVADTTGF